METTVKRLSSADPMYLAQKFVKTDFDTGTEVPGLLFFRGAFWEYSGGVWKTRDKRLVLDKIRWWLTDVRVVSYNKDGDEKENEVKTDNRTVADVAACVETVVRLNRDMEFPIWLGDEGEGPKNPHCSITFQDVVVDAATGETTPNSVYWLEPMVVPCKYDPKAECPRWEKCLEEWSEGDPRWKELLERWMAYCLMPQYSLKKWLMMYGKFNGGKNVIATVMRELMGKRMFRSRNLTQLGQRFGLSGLPNSRVINVTEAGELDRLTSDRTSQILKSVVGRDEFGVESKGKDFAEEDITIPAKLMMQGNQIPNLGNEGRGLSSKMLVLPFKVSFGEDKPMDPKLDEKLRAELAGIARRVVEAAGRLEKAEAAEKWPQAEGAGEAVKRFHLKNNPADYFLESWFVKKGDGRVEVQFLAGLWERWHKENGLVPPVSMYRLAAYLEEKSSWNLRRGRTNGGRSCMMGLGLKKEFEEKGWEL